MPIYEYGCDQCRETFEISQKISEAPLGACPKCGGPVQKLISRTSFQLKGGGWYATDYKKSGSNPASKPAASETEKKDATPAPATPEKKPGGGCGSGGCGHSH